MWLDLSSSFFLSTIALSSVVLVYGYLVTSVLPYSGFMAMRLLNDDTRNTYRGVVVNEETAGYYAGWITSSFMVGRALTSYYPWGKGADVYGRTMVLRSSLALSILGSLGFGLSTTFYGALLWRFLLGASNGLIGAARTALMEISDGNEILESRSIGVAMSMYGWSLLFSPVVSGLLADPVRQYPNLFFRNTRMNDHNENDDQSVISFPRLYHFLDRYPFFLPNLVAAVVCLGSLVMVVGLVPETLPPERRRSVKDIPRDMWRAATGQGWYHHAAVVSAVTPSSLNAFTLPNEGTMGSKTEQSALLPNVKPTTFAEATPQLPPIHRQSNLPQQPLSARDRLHYGTLSEQDLETGGHSLIADALNRSTVRLAEGANEHQLQLNSSARVRLASSAFSSTSFSDMQLPQEIVLLAAQADIDDAIRASVRAFYVEEGSLMSTVRHRNRLSTALVKRRATSLAMIQEQQHSPEQEDYELDQEVPDSESTPMKSTAATAASQCNMEASLLALRRSDDSDLANGLKDPRRSGYSNTANIEATAEASISSLWDVKTTRRQLIVFWLATFFMHSLDESLPLFLMSRMGGLGLSAMTIGMVMSLSGGIFVKLQYFVYVYMVDTFGLYGSMKVGALFMWPLVALVPFGLFLNTTGNIVDITHNFEAALFHPQQAEKTTTDGDMVKHDLMTNLSSERENAHLYPGDADEYPTQILSENEYGHITWGALIYLTVLFSLCRMCFFTLISSLIVTMNRSVSNPSHRGAVNGFCTMGGSVAKALGPPFAGLLVAFSLSSNVFATPSIGAIFMFAVLASMGAATALCVILLLRVDKGLL
ncbi:hypothetical protein ACA910_007688 [Epithemia clementina (nom. ined.)]